MIYGAVSNWVSLSQSSSTVATRFAEAMAPLPSLFDTWVLTALGAAALGFWVVILIVGVGRVREQRARERAAYELRKAARRSRRRH